MPRRAAPGTAPQIPLIMLESVCGTGMYFNSDVGAVFERIAAIGYTGFYLFMFSHDLRPSEGVIKEDLYLEKLSALRGGMREAYFTV